MKKIVFSLFATSLLLTQVSKSEVKIGDGSLTFNAAVNSQYINRGIDQNNGRLTPSVGADFNYPVKALDFGIYVGIWESHTKQGNTKALSAGIDKKVNREQDIYAGVNKAFGPVTVDVGYINYYYSGTSDKGTNNAEGYVKLTLAPDKAPYTLGLQYFKEDTAGVKNGSFIIDKNYQEANATYDFGLLQSKLSYGKLQGDTKTTTLTLSKSIVFDAIASASYINAKKDGTSSSVTKDQDFIVIGVSKTF